MLEHGHAVPQKPSRVVVLGAGGFVGGTTADRLEREGVPVVRLGRSTLDLLSDNAADRLADKLLRSDALLVVSALAPCKSTQMLVDNIKMMGQVCEALSRVPVSHVIYVSSDAVYADDPNPLHEDSRVQPDSLHGMMHAARELMLREAVGDTPYAIVRPTLLYGAADPHNGYGPNLFRTRAAAGEGIVLFGEGEERRDHVLIDDVAEIICNVLLRQSRGILNIATGTVTSFREVADMVAGHFNPPPAISGRERSGPMPHNGYRPFDPAACHAAFPDFSYTSLADGLAKAHAEAEGHTNA